jgi:hypothetical protein
MIRRRTENHRMQTCRPPKPTWLALVCWVIQALPTHAAAAEFRGMTVDNASGLPIEGVRLELRTLPSPGELVLTQTSDPLGFFRMRDVPLGEHRLHVLHPGYAPLEMPLALVANEVRHDELRLVRLPGPSGFDIYVEVVCVTASVPLTGIPIVLERFDTPGASAPAESRTLATDALGSAVFRGMSAGHVRFRVNGSGNPGWQVYSNSVLYPVAGPHQAMIHLKPVPRSLAVRVDGYDAVRQAVGPLTDVAVELTGLAPAALAAQTQAVVVPTRSGVTDPGGATRFSGLPSIPWRVRTKRLGYTPIEQIIQPSELDGTVTLRIEAELRSLSIQLTSPYTNVAVYAGVPVRLEGLTNSNTQGIDRLLATGVPADRRVFDNLLPGRYRISAEGAPESSDLIVTPPIFKAEDTVEVFAAGTTETNLPLQVIPAVIHGRLFSAEVKGSVVPEGDPTSILSSRRPAYGPKVAVGIELLEYLENPLLARTNRIFVTNTDAAGNFSIAVPPGRYGVRIESLTNHWGSHVLHRRVGPASAASDPGIAQGWPYFEPWIHSGRPPRNGTPHDGEPLILASGESSLDLFIRRQVIDVAGTLGGPSLDVVLAKISNEDVLHSRHFSAITLGNGQASLVNTDSGERSTVPFVDDGANITDLFLFPDIVPGRYQLSFSHPWLKMPFEAPDSFSFIVFEWRAPGVRPLLDPNLPTNLSPMGFQPVSLLSTAQWPAGSVAPQFEIYNWNEELDPPGYELDPGRIPALTFVQQDASPGFVFRNPTTSPPGPYTFWAHVSGAGILYRGREPGGGAAGLHPIYLGGPSATVASELPNTSYSLTYRAISNEDPSLLIPGIELGLAYDELLSAEATRITASTNRTAHGLSGPLIVVSARDPSGRWRPIEKYVTNRIGQIVISVRTNLVYDLTIVDPASRRLAVTVRMQAASALEATVTGPSSHASTTAQVYDRYGNPIGFAPVGPAGQLDIGTALGVASNITQTLYLDFSAPGRIPGRRRVAPSASEAVQSIAVNLEPLPPPTILEATVDRYGLFVPGVKRTGDPTRFLTATETLTMKWRVRVETSEVTLPTPGFDGAADSGVAPITTELDRIDAVYLVNPGRSLGDPFGIEPVPIELPDADDPIAIRRWIDDVERGVLGRVFFSRAKAIRETTTTGEMEAEGEIHLWKMPPGEFRPVVVVLTRYGAARLRLGLDLPSPSHALRGVPTPKWLATAQDIFGITAGIQPTAEMLAGYFVGERITPLPRFTASIAPGATEGHVSYLYQLGVTWLEGQESQQEGFLNFAPDPLGLEVEAEFQFGYGARAANQYFAELTADANLSGLDLGRYLPKAARNWVTDGPTGNLRVKASTLNQRNLDPEGAPWEIQFDDDFQGQLDVEAEVNLAPFTGRIPNIGPLLKVLDEADLLQSFLTLEGGVGIRARRVWETLYPPSDNDFTGAPQVYRRQVFGGDERRTVSSNRVALCFNFAAGLRFSAAGGHLGASARLAIEGSDENCLTPSLVIVPNLSAEWPPIRSVHGEINAHFEAFADLWITRFEKEWTWNLLTFTNSFATDPFLSLRPITISSRRLSPAGAPPAVFQPDATNLVDGLFPVSAFAVASGESTLPSGDALAGPPSAKTHGMLFSDSDPASGRRVLRFTRRTESSAWSAPVVVASSEGVLAAALAPLPSGGWIAVWSEIDAANLTSLTPPTRIQFSLSSNGIDWSPPAQVAALTDTAAELQMIATGNQVSVVFRHTADGPQAKRHSLSVIEWDGTRWSNVTSVATGVPLAGYRLVSDAAGGAVIVVVEQDGTGSSHAWSGGTLGPRLPCAGPVGFPFDLVTAGPGSILLVSTSTEGLALDRLDPGTGWTRIGIPVPGASASDLAAAFLPGNTDSPLVIAWVQASTATSIRVASLNQTGTIVESPRVADQMASGAHSRLTLLPDGAGGIRIVTRVDAESTSIRDLQFSWDPVVNQPPTLLRPRLVGNGELEVFLDAEVGREFTLQISTDLVQWSDLGSSFSADPTAPIRVTLPPNTGAAFLRVRATP